MIYQTAEIRWFDRGAIPPAMMSWFTKIHPNFFTEAEHTDYYYLLPNNDTLGIKLRENRIEIKKLQSMEKPIQFSPQAIGVLEIWEKWSVALHPADIKIDEIAADLIWVGVHKQRNLQRYQLTESLLPVPIACHRRVSQGFTLELSQVTVKQEYWWTIAFEFYGIENIRINEISHLKLLMEQDIIRKIFASSPDLKLDSNSSWGYPQFLNRNIVKLK